jgi:hypothetical protein
MACECIVQLVIRPDHAQVERILRAAMERTRENRRRCHLISLVTQPYQNSLGRAHLGLRAQESTVRKGSPYNAGTHF